MDSGIAPQRVGTDMKFTLIDTDIMIDLAAEIDAAINSLDVLEQHSTLAVSVITEMELVVGCRNKTELRNTQRILERFQIVSLTEKISTTASDLVKKYRLSHGLLIPDALIAATALILDCDLATRNRRDYKFIEGIRLLRYPL
jgi:predicted nucleic acid-binding protein